ncbi:glycosyl hydrolase family 18 protein [Psychromonas aquimarina]|uniref:glycosyl hydrolase family 18 protein n=1 Tax=Psychromonas aquimarina TaxID=444919 RepID=UPI0004132781|nr:glycosyl hydrolase family 18 protein [Psychromonas aquimarina]
MFKIVKKYIFTITLLTIALALTALSGCSSIDSSQGKSSRDKAENTQLIGHFFGIFGDDWENRLRDDTPFEKMDFVYIAFAHPYDQDGDGIYELGYENAHKEAPFSDQERIDQIVELAREKNPDIKLLISEGWSIQDYWKSAQNPQVFAESVVTMIRAHKLDGFDMDYEIEGDPITLPQFTALVKALRERLDKASIEDKRGDNPYLLTITPDHTSLAVWDGKVVNDNFDYVNLQTYWGERFHFIDQFADSGVDVSKMLIGLASEIHNRPSDSPQPFIDIAREHGARGIFAWRVDTDSLDEQGIPQYSIAHQMWELMGRDKAQ